MLYDEKIARQVADFLLEIKAVILRPAQPFVWASGWNSPIYCDNRLILSEPHIRNFIEDKFAEAIRSEYPETNALAGVATAGIAHAALIADRMQLPMAYVRSSPKAHGTGKAIEGRLQPGSKVVLIEDLISTGGSCLAAAQSLGMEGISVLGIMAVFSYGFYQADLAFSAANRTYLSLCDYPILLERALEKRYIDDSQVPLLEAWRMDPSTWGRPALT